MISIELARKLKAAGLTWTPTKNDFFMIPDRSLDDSVFVISDMAILVEVLRGKQAVTFHGTPEWALDHMLVADLLWLPTESQLREQLEMRLVGEPQPAINLASIVDGYGCKIQFRSQVAAFEAFGASNAYALALLYVLKHEQGDQI